MVFVLVSVKMMIDFDVYHKVKYEKIRGKHPFHC